MNPAEIAPTAITKRLRGTLLETVYWELRRHQVESLSMTASTPIGEINVTIPESDNWFIEKHANRLYEPAFFTDLSKHITTNTVYYDIGSRWGICLLAVLNASDGPLRLHGFEANRLHYEYLQRNVSETSATLTRSFVGDGDGRSLAIDDYATTHDPPSIVKIDVEGAEYAVLQGMAETIAAEHPRLYIEVHPEHLQEFGTSPTRLFDTLAGFGYRIEKCDDHRATDPRWESLDNVDLPTAGDYMVRANTSY